MLAFMLRLKSSILIPLVQSLPIVGRQPSMDAYHNQFASEQQPRSPAHGMPAIAPSIDAIDILFIMGKFLIFFWLLGAGIDIKTDLMKLRWQLLFQILLVSTIFQLFSGQEVTEPTPAQLCRT